MVVAVCICNIVFRENIYLDFGFILLCSVVVREDKKLLTVLFPDGRDGRAFTLKVL